MPLKLEQPLKISDVSSRDESNEQEAYICLEVPIWSLVNCPEWGMLCRVLIDEGQDVGGECRFEMYEDIIHEDAPRSDCQKYDVRMLKIYYDGVTYL